MAYHYLCIDPVRGSFEPGEIRGPLPQEQRHAPDAGPQAQSLRADSDVPTMIPRGHHVRRLRLALDRNIERPGGFGARYPGHLGWIQRPA